MDNLEAIEINNVEAVHIDTIEVVSLTYDIEEKNRSFYGTPSLKINFLYVQATLALLIMGNSLLQPKKIVNAHTNEDPITYLLDKEMRSFQRSNGNDIVRWVIQPNIQRDAEDPLLRCIPDFMFLWEDEETDPDLCLYAEAKRLFGTGPSLAGKYVELGVQDYIEGRYGRSHNYGIMVGYVLAGPLQKAVDAVREAMSDRKIKTAECSPFTPNNSLTSHPHTHHSTHLQKGSAEPMTIVHLFLDVC